MNRYGSSAPPRKPDWDALWTLTLSILVLLLSAGIALLPALTLVFRTARDCSDRPRSADLILVFGKKLRGGKPDAEYVARLRKTAQILRDFPHSLAILMGGSAVADEISEAEAGLIYLTKIGVPDGARIRLEQESGHTLENLRNVRDQLASLGGRSTLLVSNRYHLARCSLVAGNLHIGHRVCAAEERLILDPANSRKLLVEAFFVHWFKTGKHWATLTGSRRMLSRIT